MDTSQYKPRRRWPLILGGIAAVLVVLYFVLTSGAFVRAVVLPRVAAALHSDVTVESVSLSPFSSLTLRKLKLTPQGAETLATVEEVRLRYSLFAILGGTMKVQEVTVDTPVITVIGKPDGTSNLSKLLDDLAKDQKPSEPSAPGQPAQLDVRNISLKNGTLRQSLVTTNGVTTAEITGLNVTLDQLVNGAQSKLTLAAGVGLTASGTNTLAAKLDGSLGFGLDAKLQPGALNGSVDLAVSQAGGAFRDIGKVALKLTTDITPTEIKQLRLAISESGRLAGELNVTGPVDLEKKEMRLTYELKGVDRTALGMVGAMTGTDFGQTSIGATGRIDLAQRGQIFASFGKVSINKLTVKSTAGTTPELDLGFDYKLQVNLEEKTALIEKADLSVDQRGAAVVRGALDRPMNIAWAASAPGFREATYTLTVKEFDLAPWRSVAGPDLPGGRVNVNAGVTADRDGRRLKFNVDSAVTQVAMKAGDTQIQDLNLSLKLGGSLEDFQVFLLEQATGDVRHAGREVAKYTGFVNWNQRSGEAGGQTTVEVQLPAALKLMPVEGVQLSSGVAQFTGQVSIRSGQTNGTAGFSLTGLTGTAYGAALKDYQANLETAAAVTSQTVSLRRGSLALRSGADAGGSLDVTGEFGTQTQRGAFEFRTVNLNEKAIGPFFAAAIAPNELRSVSLDLNGKVQVDLKGESSLQSALKVSRLVARDPAGKLPQEPLAFGVELDAGQRAQALDLRKLLVDLGATARASNRLQAVGKFDLATNAPAPSSLKLTSDGLDLTTLYNMFSGSTSSAKSETKPAAPAPAESGKLGEPIVLPLKQFSLDASIAKFFLREVAISNWVTQLDIQGGKVVLKPFALTLNGAPVSATGDFDVSVPGYRYDLQAGLDNVPIPPIAKSFLTGDLVELKGTVTGKLNLAGAGVEGADLRKNLKGGLQFAATNLDYQVSALQSPLMKMLVGGISESLKIPSLSQSPLQFIGSQMEVGQGDVNLQSFQVRSASFATEAQGKIQLADNLNDSTLRIPVTVSLPKDGKMTPLPQFLTLAGTIGAPKKDINPEALLQAAAQLPGAAGALVNQAINKAGSSLDRLLGNKDSTNAGPASSLLKGLLPGGSNTNQAVGTNTPATNAPAKQLNPLDLLKKIGK
ncbi:MAG: AsmA family protein [Verrucomicrobia bacterium]|nr:AsmA family protein [Verrucomicrobiota bacterium]